MDLLGKILLGLGVTAIGLIIVFIVLILIVGLLKVLRPGANAIAAVGKRKRAKKEGKEIKMRKKDKKAIDSPKEAQTVQEKPPGEGDEAIIAVLSAAVAYSMGTSVDRIRIVSYKRSDRRTAWAKAAKREQINVW